MKRRSPASGGSTPALMFVLGCICTGVFFYFSAAPENIQVEVCFSPRMRCEKQVLAEIDRAQSEILVHAYAFTSKPIARSLIRAHERGLNVAIIHDPGQLELDYSQLHRLKSHGVPLYPDPAEGLGHNKVMIIDDTTVLTGSYNWTNAANYRNSENLLIIRSRGLAKGYKENWYAHQGTPM